METTILLSRQAVLSLLLADMRNRKLIHGLEKIGLHSEDFYMDLSEFIFRQMGFTVITDEMYDWYEHTLEALMEMEIEDFLRTQRDLALKMYDLLVWKRLVEE